MYQLDENDIKKRVWNKYVGIENWIILCPGGCRKYITRKKFECARIKSEKNGGGFNLLNLVPVCRNCSNNISYMNMTDFVIYQKSLKFIDKTNVF